LLKTISPQINKLLLSLSLCICERSKWEIICDIYTLYILPYLLDKLCKFAWTHIQKIWLWKSKPVCMPGHPTRPFNPTCVFRSFMYWPRLFNKYKTFSVLIYSYVNTNGNWENEKLYGNTTPEGWSVFAQFRVFPISTSVDITVCQYG
jgi:hypothetical protein